MFILAFAEFSRASESFNLLRYSGASLWYYKNWEKFIYEIPSPDSLWLHGFQSKSQQYIFIILRFSLLMVSGGYIEIDLQLWHLIKAIETLKMLHGLLLGKLENRHPIGVLVAPCYAVLAE